MNHARSRLFDLAAILVAAVLLAGFLAGGLWGFIPGILKARFGVNEILSTVMLNVVAAQILIAMLHGPLMDTAGVTAGTYLAQSEQLLIPLKKQLELTRDLIRALAGNPPNEVVSEIFELASLHLPEELPPGPETWDLREDWWNVGNQNETGACVGYAVADSVLRWCFAGAPLPTHTGDSLTCKR